MIPPGLSNCKYRNSSQSSSNLTSARSPHRMPKISANVLEAAGNTALLRLNRVTAGIFATVCVKLEASNPGRSVKDRIGLAEIEDAERRGLLELGGTIVEPTSGNMGVALAIVAAVKGYKCIFTIPDKMGIEKIRRGRAFGAEVVVTPTAASKSMERQNYQDGDVSHGS
jgi:cystathionine beta-synthase